MMAKHRFGWVVLALAMAVVPGGPGRVIAGEGPLNVILMIGDGMGGGAHQGGGVVRQRIGGVALHGDTPAAGHGGHLSGLYGCCRRRIQAG